MTARNRADAISHGHDGKPEGEGNTELSNLRAREHSRATAKQDKREGSDEFGDEDFHELHSRRPAGLPFAPPVTPRDPAVFSTHRERCAALPSRADAATQKI